MQVKQIYSIINSAAKQAFGATAVEAQNLTGLIAMGDTVLSTATTKDAFLNVLVDRIAKTIIQSKVYSGKTRKVLMDTFSYGAAIQKTYTEPEEASKNDAWDIQEGGELGPGTIHLPTVKVKIFENHDTWKYTVCIPDYQMDTAFTSESEMASFITSIYNSVETSMNLALENMVNLCMANFIAEKLDNQKTVGNGVQSVNLLAAYNTLTNAGLTVDKCLMDAGFLKFAGKEIKRYIDKFENITQIYNTEGYKRFTPKEDMNVLFLSDYAAANATYLESDTYHKELVALPGYDTVTYWQGLGTTGSFTDVSTVDVTTSSGKTVKQSGVIGFVFDKNALGVMFDKKKTTSYVDPDKDVTKIWNKATMGYFNDLSENAIVFYIAEA